MQSLKIFSTHLYKFTNENHELEYPLWMEYLNNSDNFTNTRNNSKLHFTSPNLHKEPVFDNLTNWMKNCLLQAMADLGFMPLAQITSVWGTRHVDGGFHARHSHGNTFLAGVYYLSGSPKNSGTRWFNANRCNSIIIPQRDPEKQLKTQPSWYHGFEPGTLIIFPGWLEHHTEVNDLAKTQSERFIIGFNSMPLDKTNQDEFDRYHYYEAQPEDMISTRNEVVK